MFQIQDDIFSEYARYFLDPEISRQHTVREWWMHCATEMHVNPQLKLPFSDFSSEIREQLGSFLASVVMEACKLPTESSTSFSSRDTFLDFKTHLIYKS